MDKVYLGFIAYAIKNFGILKSQWKILLTDSLKVKSVDASSKILREASLRLYYAHFIGLNMCIKIDAFIESAKTSNDLKNILIDFDKLRTKNGLPELQVINYTDNDKAIAHMKKFQEPTSIISDILKVKSPIKSRDTKTKILVRNEKISPNKIKKIYTVIQLREMAKKKEMKGYSKMNKAELMKALKIKH